MSWLGIVIVGAGVGFLGGLFGKGGSAIATPMLHAMGVPAFVAVAAPLPATIPSTLVATMAYRRERLVDRRVVLWSLSCGVPATAVGALATRWVSGGSLVLVTDIVIVGLGLRFALAPRSIEGVTAVQQPSSLRLASVAIIVGLASGLLANSGGFLLAPLYLAVLHMPVKESFASSLAVATVLAIPGTLVHWSLGHIDWQVVAVFGAASVPLSYTGAQVAIRTDAHRLERIYGVVLVVLGVLFLTILR